MFDILLLNSTRIGSPVLGVILPAVIFGLSVTLTFMLIKHFTKQHKEK
jgi:hypothetical protein